MQKGTEPTIKTEIIKNKSNKLIRNKLLIGTPTLGIVRMEWSHARFQQVIPCNWSASSATIGYSHQVPMGYLVADAQNILVHNAVIANFQWLLLVEDDVVMPIDAFLKFNEYIKSEKIPVVSGLYYLKKYPTEPILYRGRGNSCYDKFKLGDKVWVDGVPTGCLLIHGSLLQLMWKESPFYITGNNQKVKKVFETPAKVWHDPETGRYQCAAGTSDLYWCDRVINENVLERAGWKAIAKKKWPFLVDTSIFCKHIDLTTGTMFP